MIKTIDIDNINRDSTGINRLYVSADKRERFENMIHELPFVVIPLRTTKDGSGMVYEIREVDE